MNSSPPNSSPESPNSTSLGVPKDLKTKFHALLQQLHQAHLELEQIMDGFDHNHQEHVTLATARFQDLDRQVETVEQEIAAFLRKPLASPPPNHP